MLTLQSQNAAEAIDQIGVPEQPAIVALGVRRPDIAHTDEVQRPVLRSDDHAAKPEFPLIRQ